MVLDHMSVTDCYLCGKPLEDGQAITGDHVIPTALLGRKQPKVRGFDYCGRIPTHQECNNHFSDENFFKQAIHLVELVQTGAAHGALQHAANPDISILPVTPDQVSEFVDRDFKRFNFIDTREIDVEELKDPKFYADKRKTNLLKVAAHAAMTVKAKSAAALLVKRKLKRVPPYWRIFASPFEISGSPALSSLFESITPFGKHTRASLREIRQDEWLVAYQHKSLLTLFLFVLHAAETDINQVFNAPGSEVHAYSGDSLNGLLTCQWHVV